MVLGAVQVPPNGQPVVFLADHPTTGGYPVIGVVVPDDLAACAQLRPGEQVTLRVVVTGASAGSSTREGEHRPGPGLGGLEADRDHAAARAPDPARPVLLVHDVHAGCPAAVARGCRDRRLGVLGSASPRPRSSSAKRSSWIQSARPETPTPRRRTPPEVSSSPSSARASRAIGAASSEGSGSVAERLCVVKSCSRTLIVTVRPERRDLRSRSATLAAWRSSSASRSRLSTWSVS